ncbi:unnamed protein product [marine sediment metagenome]|uniref:CN hydrolase domain-containing protein n=1 Tax=marine sediment metagenome TaxID=412755 RepID=X1I6U5_9ZZZZ
MVNKLKVACLQVSAREYEDRYENKENILRMIDKAADSHPQLMVLPECVYPAYYISPLIVKKFFRISEIDFRTNCRKLNKELNCINAI